MVSAFKNKLFLASVLIGCFITILSFINSVNAYNTEQELFLSYAEGTRNPRTAAYTLFSEWIGGEPFSLGTSLYFFLFPVMIALPFGWSYCEEKNTGYYRMLVTKTGKTSYFIAKYIAVFLSGGCAMVIPLLFNFFMVSMVIPAVTPMVTYNIYYAVFGSSLMSELYYTTPFLYVFAYLCIDFIVAGLLAEISFLASNWLPQKWSVVLCPFFVCLLIHFLRKYIYIAPGTIYKEISPILFLRPAESAYAADWRIVIGMAAILFLSTFFVNQRWNKKHEIY